MQKQHMLSDLERMIKAETKKIETLEQTLRQEVVDPYQEEADTLASEFIELAERNQELKRRLELTETISK